MRKRCQISHFVIAQQWLQRLDSVRSPAAVGVGAAGYECERLGLGLKPLCQGERFWPVVFDDDSWNVGRKVERGGYPARSAAIDNRNAGRELRSASGDDIERRAADR